MARRKGRARLSRKGVKRPRIRYKGKAHSKRRGSSKRPMVSDRQYQSMPGMMQGGM